MRQHQHTHPHLTDNQGNAYTVLNHNTKKWPCSAILKDLRIGDRNTWADQLSNLDFDGFDPDLRVDINEYEGSRLIVLPSLLSLQKDVMSHTTASNVADTVAM